ncbi:hypothetical protein K435DRAFT_729807 [Dendrothele bispora CBS 962.96]|uniref:DUF3752 domain-containing protein n=1 Tax=Dendrothele bispora (strain CBS 962.96) TaxID=1314807 RepID=A0A4S8LIG7_DENBC|nr:hypothetical protein K435DRAFT_729807 [Dendrothele bispora CBS 962.96]
MSSIGPELPPHLAHLQNKGNDNEEEGKNPGAESGPEPAVSEAKQSQNGIGADDSAEEDEDEDDYAPALPPEMLVARSSGPVSSSAVAGPSTNKRVLGPALPNSSSSSYSVQYQRDDLEDSDDDIGPMPLPPGAEKPEEVDGVKQFLEKEENRRKQVEEAAKPKALKRDEWMIVPPSSSDLLGTLDPKKLSKGRQFSRSAAPAKDVDNSLWTETPAEKQQRLADEVSGKKRKATNADVTMSAEEAAEAQKRQRRDEMIRKGVDQHTRNVRGAALVDAHTKSMKATQEEDPKADMIWDHSRDMSVGGRLMDDGDRNKMIRDAKALGDRFSSGRSGGFL